MDTIFFLIMIVAIVAALGPHHRRTFSLPRAPFGADAALDRDIERVLPRRARRTLTRGSPTEPRTDPATVPPGRRQPSNGS